MYSTLASLRRLLIDRLISPSGKAGIFPILRLEWMKRLIRRLVEHGQRKRGATGFGVTPVGRDGAVLKVFSALTTQRNIRRLKGSCDRKLEIGPGPQRIPGFETVNITSGSDIDYICDATKRMPFEDDAFELIYASHILEHIAWYKTAEVLREWVRILRPGGWLEIWVPDGLKICKAFVDAEYFGTDPFENDPWTRFNEERDPCKWASGRIFTYGDGTGGVNDPNWHHSVFSRRYLHKVMEQAGLASIVEMKKNEIRGYDHGWINLGMKGMKPEPRPL